MALVSIRIPDVPGLRFFTDGQALPVGELLQVEDDVALPSTLSIALTDELLSAGSQTGGFDVLATIDAGGSLSLRAGSADSPLTGLDAAGGLLEIRWLELTLVLNDADGDGTLDTLSTTTPPAATGRVRWPGAAELGFASSVELQLGYADGQFSLSLPAHVDWPSSEPVIRLAAGSRLSARMLVDRHPIELALGLDGDVGLVPGSDAQNLIDRTTGVLNQLLGSSVSPPTTQQFALRQRFALPDSGQLGAGAPLWEASRLRFGLSPGLGPDPTPQAGSLLDALPVNIQLGHMAFDLPLLDAGVFGNWQLRLTDVALGFPQVQGMGLPMLRGDLLVEEFDPLDPLALVLAFEPASIQPFDLPEALRFLIARLQWLLQAIRLEELLDQVGLSFNEAQWLAFFMDALSDSPSETVLQNLIQAAMQVLDVERVFALLLSAIGKLEPARNPLGWTTLAWNLWYSVGEPALASGVEPRAALARLLHRLYELAPESLPMLAGGLFARADTLPVQPGPLARALLELAPTIPAARLPDFAGFGARVIAAAAQHLPGSILPGQVAVAVFDLLRPSQRSPALQVLSPPLPMPPGLQGSARVPLIDWLVGRILAALAVGPLALAPTAGWDRLPGVGVPTVNALRAMLEGVETLGANVLAMFHGLFASMELESFTDPAERALALEREWAMLNLVRRFPASALLLIPASIAFSFGKFPGLFAQLVWKNVEEDEDLVTSRLHEPDAGTRYLIVSDIHRDAESDDQGRVQFGSIHHFLDNSALYRQVLEWVRDNGYTLIENGDCEELWYIREAFEYDTPAAKMEAIMETHREIYADLWELFLQGRYYRVMGNHDSYLREMMTPEEQGGVTLPWLQWRWKEVAEFARPELAASLPASIPTLLLHDFLVIDGVKTMGEKGFLELVGDAWSVPAYPQQAVNDMLAGRLGMDAAAYTEKKPMLVCHGHQFDIWNHDETAVIGKLISNGVGVPIDQLMDPFMDLKGIALGGSSLIDFRRMLARAPVANSWLADNVSLQMAHEIQHQDDSTRLPIDDIMFSESLAILLGNFLMPLEQPVWETVDDHDVVKRDANGNPELVPGNWLRLEGIRNHLCLGHTHTPQSQPYYQIPDPLAAPLRPLVEAAQGAVNAMLPLGMDFTTDTGIRLPVRSHYYNTGTASWFRGVVWGIEITESGQARAVYFTPNSRGPETMDWELKELDPEVRAWIENLSAGLPASTPQAWVAERLNEAGDFLGERFREALSQLYVPGVVSLPLESIMCLHGVQGNVPVLVLKRVDTLDPASGQNAIRDAGEQMAHLHGFFLRLVAVLVQRRAGAIASVNGRMFQVALPVDGESAERFALLLELFQQIGGDRAPQFAAAAFVALNRLPMLGADPTRLPSELRMLQGRAPLLAALLSMAATLPFGELDSQLPGGISLRASLTLQGGTVTLTVQLQESGG